MQYRKRAAFGLALLAAAGVAGVGIAPAAHAASSTPTLNAAITAYGTLDQFLINGAGFTPGAPVNVKVLDAATGALLQTIPTQASAGTGVTTYVTEQLLVCNGGYAGMWWDSVTQTWQLLPGYQGSGLAPVQQVPSGYTRDQMGVSSAPQQTPTGYTGDMWSGSTPTGQSCEYQLTSVPETIFSGGGGISATFALAISTTSPSVLVEAIDTATGVVSNEIVLNA